MWFKRQGIRPWLSSSTAICILFLSSSASAQTPECSDDRAAVLALGQSAFDQDMKGGWRALADRGCLTEAADLIRDYRLLHKPQRGSTQAIILYWHEGQNRAMSGENEAAIALFDSSRALDAGSAAWNLYVDATIFFLKNNKAALLAARDAMASLGSTPNLRVVDNLLACFGRPYKEAYSGCKMP
ncbi:MAG: hypothetical protein WDM77_12025 [Steroidobacteraceae bacterium]